MSPLDEVVAAVKASDGFVIGSPTLGGHMPTQVQLALGSVLRETRTRQLPCGVFGSFGWSGEAVDEIEGKLKDGGYGLAFDSIRVKFKPGAKVRRTAPRCGLSLTLQRGAPPLLPFVHAGTRPALCLLLLNRSRLAPAPARPCPPLQDLLTCEQAGRNIAVQVKRRLKVGPGPRGAGCHRPLPSPAAPPLPAPRAVTGPRLVPFPPSPQARERSSRTCSTTIAASGPQLAMGRVVGALSVVTARDEDVSTAMLVRGAWGGLARSEAAGT
jgi:hypothetical protein